jgi:hypothetical protein
MKERRQAKTECVVSTSTKFELETRSQIFMFTPNPTLSSNFHRLDNCTCRVVLFRISSMTNSFQ